MQRALLVGMGLVLVGGVVTPVVTPMEVDTASAATRAAMPFDFDGDGFADIAVGVPFEDIGSVRDAGAVQVLYGSASGATARDQLWHLGRKGVRGGLKRGYFGERLASGDFDGDGRADLAVGSPLSRPTKDSPNAGVVQVLYGSPSGLTAAGDQVWHQGTKGVPGNNKKGDLFGQALAVGDFDGDGYADLGIGIPGKFINGIGDAGRVIVLRGSSSGLTATGVQSWSEQSPGIASEPEGGDGFGKDLAAGDVTGDGRDDLTIGVAYVLVSGGETVGDQANSVHLLMGSPSGLTSKGSQLFPLADLGPAVGSFIASLWLGDVDADGHDDLALGTSAESVALLHGHDDGLHPSVVTSPARPGEDSVWPGYAVAVSGDLTGDGHVDLALANYPRDTDEPEPIGVAIGTGQGIGSETQLWPNESTRTLNVLALSGGTHAWLIQGDSDTGSFSTNTAGSVTVRQGTGSGDPGPATVWSQDSPGIKDVAEEGDYFGLSLGGVRSG